MITQADALARLRLIRSENVGTVTYQQLIARFGSAEAALEAIPDLARRGGARSIRVASAQAGRDEMAQVERAGASLLFLGVAPYPALLAHVHDAPAVLTMKGHAVLFDRPAVAMVGARNASAAGQTFARRLAADLADAGVVVVSGLARGIDGAAHAGALSRSPDGGTVAVVAGGLDVIYPPQHEDLHRQICAQGVVLAEQPMGAVAQARHFPRRNRIISGLSLGTIVVEAAPRSGSLITARFAGEQGRLVMAVPGSPMDPRAQGANGLIRDGATLVQGAADVLELIAPLSGGRMAEPDRTYGAPAAAFEDPDDQARGEIAGLLSFTPVEVNELVRLSGLPVGVVATVLLELELAGRLTRHAGGKVAASAPA